MPLMPAMVVTKWPQKTTPQKPLSLLALSYSKLLRRCLDRGQHVVLGDAKSSTYKLALLRSVARIADRVAWDDARS